MRRNLCAILLVLVATASWAEKTKPGGTGIEFDNGDRIEPVAIDQDLTTGSAVGFTSLTLNTGATITAITSDASLTGTPTASVATTEAVKSYVDTAAAPGGADTQVQYNSSGSLAGDVGLTYGGSGALTVVNGGDGTLFNASNRALNGGYGDYFFFLGDDNGGRAANFDDGSNIVDVCNDTYAVQVASGTMIMANGSAINEFSTDTTLAGSSDLAVPTENAVKTYVDTNVDQNVKTTGSPTFSGVAAKGFFETVHSYTGTVTLTLTQSVVVCSGTFTVNLPAVATAGTTVGGQWYGKTYTIKNKGAGVITVDGSGIEDIDLELTQAVASMDCIVIFSDKTRWWIK